MANVENRRGCTVLRICSLVAALGNPVSAEPAKQLANPSTDVTADWLSNAEKSDFTETATYNETIQFCKNLETDSEWIKLELFGRTPHGKAMPLVIASKSGLFNHLKRRESADRVVLIQNCIHAGECAGKDASLMLLRDIAITKKRQELLDGITLLVIPIYNVDGHERFGPHNRINQNGPKEMGWRTTSRNLNLNRDYLKADAQETRNWIKLWNEWEPDLHIDTHTTDGGDWQYDVLLAWDDTPTAAPSIARWLRETLEPNLFSALEKDGHVPSFYFDLADSKDPSKGLVAGGFEPRYSTGYVSLRNRPSILVETHMLKPYRTRVIAQYNVLTRALEIVKKYGNSLGEAILEADVQTVRLGATYDSTKRFSLSAKPSEKTMPFSFKGVEFKVEPSPISGTDRIVYDGSRPKEIQTTFAKELTTDQTVAPPLGYIIPPQWQEVTELLEIHGVKTSFIRGAAELEVESYRLTNVKFAERPYEGRFRAQFDVELVKETRTYPSSSAVVFLNRPQAKIAIHLLEPKGPDSLAAWGYFNAIFEQKEYAEGYVLEDLAVRMLAEDEKLKSEFEQRVNGDPAFAADPRARLTFFYHRSPYWDNTIGVYPVGRLTKPMDHPIWPP